MAIQDLKEQIGRLPEQPGVYLWRNRAGVTVYVGKARSLRDRVRSYLGARGTSAKTDALLDEISSLDVIVTDSVSEALALENNLIKEQSPKYNILLRDDKNYPYLRLTTGEAFPRVLVARAAEDGADFYAGPFLPARLARRTMDLTHRLFGVRSCNEVITGQRDRPCLEYDIKRCLAPCVADVCSPDRYGEAVVNAKLLLEGRTDALVQSLRQQMLEAAEGERFEEAAHLRDAVATVATLRDRQQKVATATQGERDVFGLKLGPSGAVIHVFVMRAGRVIQRLELATDPGSLVGDSGEVLEAALRECYETRVPPPEIDLPPQIEEHEAIDAWLSARAGRRVRLHTPQRGDRRGLVELATRNAELSYRTRFSAATTANFDALESLRDTLALPGLPCRIEGFDISTIQGSETVASLVVCEDGRMKKRDYRRYRVQVRAKHNGPDDFAAMREVVVRRYRSALDAGGPFPDLILIDGGRGQVSAAYAGLEEVGLGNLVAIGLAKREELVVTRDRTEPIVLAANAPALLLLQRIRDEAHRVAITYHRRARHMRDLRSELDEVPGIGPRKRRTLLATFGSVAGVRRATREELASVVGPRAAGALLAFFAAHS